MSLIPIREKPAAGQESVWDFPRPAQLEPVTNHLLVKLATTVIAETRRGFRVIETTHPPTYYFPPDDVRLDLLIPIDRDTTCGWKGEASYFDVNIGGITSLSAAWMYLFPTHPFGPIAGYLAFYPGKLECELDGERAAAQHGNFYGGWITSKVAGPFKGKPGSELW